MSVADLDNITGDEYGAFQSDPDIWRVNEYEVTREYGGPEEGGWWYDMYRPTGTSIILPGIIDPSEAYDVAHDLQAFADVTTRNDRPYTSVYGGWETRWRAEPYPPHETERMTYS